MTAAAPPSPPPAPSSSAAAAVVAPVRCQAAACVWLFTDIMKCTFMSILYLVLTSLLAFGIDTLVQPESQNAATSKKPPTLATMKSRPPTPFFGEDSQVRDFYSGDIYALLSEAAGYENALVLYYAPWDADCRALRPVFQSVAQAFVGSDLYVAAVNCWTGVCRLQFNPAQSDSSGPAYLRPRLAHNQWPMVVFYPAGRPGFKYLGPWSVQALLEFLVLARRPVQPIHSKLDLLNLRAAHGGRAVVAFFDSLTTSAASQLSFGLYLSVVYHFLELDPIRSLTGGFGVVTSAHVARTLQLANSQPLRYFFWNGSSVAYPKKSISSAQPLSLWIKEKANSEEPLLSWVGVVGRKSRSLADRLRTASGHSLIVFLPRLNRFMNNPLHDVVQQVALRYKSCSTSADTDLLLSRFQASSRSSDDPVSDSSWSSSTLAGFKASAYCRPVNCSRQCSRHEALQWHSQTSSCQSCSFRDANVQLLSSMQHLLQSRLSRFTSGSTHNWHPPSSEHRTGLDIGGWACHHNTSLNMYTSDLATQKGLAAHLGLHMRGQKAAAIIVSPSRETIYVMNGDLSVESLSAFVHHFHTNVSRLSQLKLSSPDSDQDQPEESPAVAVHQLRSDTFQQELCSRSEPSLLLYHQSNCGACLPVHRAFLSMKLLLTEAFAQMAAKSPVHFFSINVSDNDVPWNFRPLSTPTILFVPAHCSAQSRVFPSDVKVADVANLFSFLLANLPRRLRFQVAFALSDGLVRQEMLNGKHQLPDHLRGWLDFASPV